jgi:hypothetical protein
MASRAFVAVARAVLFAMADPDDESRCLLGQPKNNLGRSNLPTLTYRIGGTKVAETDEGPVWTGRLEWTGESEQSIHEALEATVAPGHRSATRDATDWLADYLDAQGGGAESAEVKAAGRKAGHARGALDRAARKLKVSIDSFGFPRQTYWSLPGAAPRPIGGENEAF